jgi:signal transduction histidine kinase
MRRRLLSVYLGLLTVVLVGLAVPLAFSVARHETQALFIDRINDTARLAWLAEPAVRTGQSAGLIAELGRYEERSGVTAVIVGRDGRPLSWSHPDLVLPAGTRQRIEMAMSGRPPEAAAIVWPWHRAPLLVAGPIGPPGDIAGAVLTISPTDRQRASILAGWGALAGGTVVVLLVVAASAGPLAGWMMRPVRDLDEAARALAAGRLRQRVPVTSGPAELRRLSESFNTMAERLDTVIERQRTFVSYASHQLRTPLATLRIRADSLAGTASGADRAGHELLAEEIDRLARMCDALLAFARTEAAAAQAQDVDVGRALDARLAAWRPVATGRGASLVRAGEESAVARVSAEVLEQSLDALIENAVKFGGEGVTVTLAVRRPLQTHVDIHVIDNGPGMSAGDLARAARPFWRPARDADSEGSGLGLTIVAALVGAAGGRLHLGRAEPHGVDARIRVPLAEPSAAGRNRAGPNSREDQ